MFERELWKHRNLVTGIFFMMVIGLVMMATMALLPPMLADPLRLFGVRYRPAADAARRRRGADDVDVGASSSSAAGSIRAGLVGIGLADRRRLAVGDVALDARDGLARPSSSRASVQGLGLGLVFMPLNGLAFAGLAPAFPHRGLEPRSNPTRNIGASVGISAGERRCSRAASRRSHAISGRQHVTATTMNGLGPTSFRALGRHGRRRSPG